MRSPLEACILNRQHISAALDSNNFSAPPSYTYNISYLM